ncbi:hypothetical protein GS940_22095 [Rhodococcus hoagii]|nr:hypothetical protein [Prescottella equi]
MREGLMSHLTHRLAISPEAAAIQRDFPGLPDAYAEEVVANGTAEQRERLLAQGRPDLGLAEKARLALQEARACRALQGLYLENAYDLVCRAGLRALAKRTCMAHGHQCFRFAKRHPQGAYWHSCTQ